MSKDAIEVIHEDDRKRYVIELEGKTAYMLYSRDGNVSVFTSTVTPPELQGRGLAGKIVKRALEDARAEGLKVVPQCSYVQAYIKRHPEFADLVAEEQ